MGNWYECRVRVPRVQESGEEKKVVEVYLVDAVTFTEAEATIVKEMEGTNFAVSGIRASNIREVWNHDGDHAYKVKMSLLTVDEEAGREKKAVEYALLFADGFFKATEMAKRMVEAFSVPVEVESVSLSPILEVIYPGVTEVDFEEN